MSATREGGLKAAETNKERYGSDYYKKLGRAGGQAQVPKGVAINGRAKELGGIGGKLSKRGYRMYRNAEGEVYYEKV